MNKQNGGTNMSEEIKDIMDALENNELKNDGFWGRACSRLSQQLQTAKEENEKLAQQNKQMREALNWLEELLRENYNDEEEQIICVAFAYEKIQQVINQLKEVK